MRLLSKVEKEICRRIQNHPNHIQNILDHDLEGMLIEVHYEKKAVVLLFPRNDLQPTQDESQEIIDKINQLVMLIVIIVNLLKMLEKEGYLLSYQVSNTPDTYSRFGRGLSNKPHMITHSLPDPDVAAMLIAYCRQVFFPTPEFKRFCNRGFRARDEQRFRRQITMTYIAVAVAFAVGISNIGLNIRNALSTKATTIDSTQVQPVMQHLQELNTSNQAVASQLMMLREWMVKQDSLKNKKTPRSKRSK